MPRRRGTTRNVNANLRSSANEFNCEDLPPELPPIKPIPFNIDLVDLTNDDDDTVGDGKTNDGIPTVDVFQEQSNAAAAVNKELRLPAFNGMNKLVGPRSASRLPTSREATFDNSAEEISFMFDTSLHFNEDIDPTQVKINDKLTFNGLQINKDIEEYTSGRLVWMCCDNADKIYQKMPTGATRLVTTKRPDPQAPFMNTLFSTIVAANTELDIIVPESQEKKTGVNQKLAQNPAAGDFSKPTAKDIAELMNVSEAALERIEFFQDNKIMNYIRNPSNCDAIFPELLKILAFSYWQKNDLNRCVYVLTAISGIFLRNEICDRYLLNISRMEEKPESEENTQLKNCYLQYMDDMNSLAEVSAPDFKQKIKEINPEWNVVQITTMFRNYNRFARDVVAPRETPGLFLTSYSCPYNTSTRGLFTTYVPPPVKNTAVTNKTILEDFADVMYQNRKISMHMLDRRSYWETRANHNSKLKCVLAAVEENWIYPWSFLLPGDLVDTSSRKAVIKTVQSIETAYKKKLTSTQTLLFTKIVGNYGLLEEQIRCNLGHLVSHILEDNKFPVDGIVNIIRNTGKTIHPDSDRYPTIIILDQEIEQIPWESLKCLKTTSVTRIQSLPILYSSMKLLATKKLVDPKRGFYVLNPENNLPNVQTRLEDYLKSHDTWTGVVGIPPIVEEVDANLKTKDVYVYCGHGNGQNCYPENNLRRIHCNAAALLMGCSSAQYRYHGPRSSSSSVLNAYATAMCNAVVGFLWEVTDVECDRVTVELLERWVPAPPGTELPRMPAFNTSEAREQVKCLATAVRKARKVATQFLTEAGLVMYGLPVRTR